MMQAGLCLILITGDISITVSVAGYRWSLVQANLCKMLSSDANKFVSDTDYRRCQHDGV